MNQTHTEQVDLANDAKTGKTHGVIYLNSVYINKVPKKLKQPIQLKINISEKGVIHLANTEYKILVSCNTLQETIEEAMDEAIEDAMNEYDTMYQIFNDPKTPRGDSAIAFGQKLKDSLE